MVSQRKRKKTKKKQRGRRGPPVIRSAVHSGAFLDYVWLLFFFSLSLSLSPRRQQINVQASSFITDFFYFIFIFGFFFLAGPTTAAVSAEVFCDSEKSEKIKKNVY